MHDHVAFRRRVAGNRRVALSVTLLATCVAVALGGAFAVDVAFGHGRDGRGDGFRRGVVPAAAGIVQSAASGDGFTIETRGGATETVDVSSPSTTYYERGISSPSLANVAKGDFVVVFGTVSGSTVTASKIVIGGSPRNHGFAVAGTVQGMPGADSFTIKTPSGATDTVDVSPTTSYFERGVLTVSLSDVAAGDYVAVFGTVSGSTVTATKVAIATPQPSNGQFATAGTVQTSPSGGSFVIETWNHTQVIVQTSSSTTYTERGVSGASLADIAIADNVAVFGTVSGASVTATQVAVGGNGVGGGPGYLGGRGYRGGGGGPGPLGAIPGGDAGGGEG
jgi:hypothetical protein